MGLIIIMIRYLVLMVALIEAATAVTHQVGGNTGWDVPSSPAFYTTWASSQTFAVGDILEFKWTGTHDVLEVTKTEYDDCTETNRVPLSTSPVSVTLTNTTARYFICTVGSHCKSGQKLAVTSVSATNSTTTPTTSPPPATPTTSPPPPSGSSASMATAALLPALLSTIAIISFLITI